MKSHAKVSCMKLILIWYSLHVYSVTEEVKTKLPYLFLMMNYTAISNFT